MNSNLTTPRDSLPKILLLGVQHVFAMFGATVLVPALTGMNPAIALFTAGLGTILFYFITGRKVPVFLGSSFAFIAAIQGAAYAAANSEALRALYAEGGSTITQAIVYHPDYQAALPYAFGGIICAGGLYVVLALLVLLFGADRIKSFFPPVVTGPMIIVIGLMLAPTAISSITAQIGGTSLWINWVVAAFTIALIIVVTLFTKGFFKLVPILIGIIGGYLFAMAFGIVDLEPLREARWMRWPFENYMAPKFSWQTIVMIAPIAIVTFVEHVGDITASSAVVGKDFVKNPGLTRTLLGDGLATMAAGVLGGPANTTYSENTGVLAATKNYNPLTIICAACIAVLLSLIGKLGALLSTMPGPVMGGVSVILFGMIAAVGLRTLIENQVDLKKTRNLLIVSIMLVLGIGSVNGDAISINYMIDGVPATLGISGVALAAVFGIVLNKLLPDRKEI